MKTSELTRYIYKRGCRFKRHGAGHDIWINPQNGGWAAIPRHEAQEVKPGTLKKILRGLFGTE